MHSKETLTLLVSSELQEPLKHFQQSLFLSLNLRQLLQAFNNVKSDIDEDPVHGVLHLKAFEEDVRLEQSDCLIDNIIFLGVRCKTPPCIFHSLPERHEGHVAKGSAPRGLHLGVERP